MGLFLVGCRAMRKGRGSGAANFWTPTYAYIFLRKTTKFGIFLDGQARPGRPITRGRGLSAPNNL